jgi:beta-galactosidase
VSVSVVDEAGRPVLTADNLVRFELSGSGKILGVGNGDPSSHESEIAPHRSLFNGLALVLVQSTSKAGEIRLVARGEGLTGAVLRLKTVPAGVRPSAL